MFVFDVPDAHEKKRDEWSWTVGPCEPLADAVSGGTQILLLLGIRDGHGEAENSVSTRFSFSTPVEGFSPIRYSIRASIWFKNKIPFERKL